jgi:hypothetical protein
MLDLLHSDLLKKALVFVAILHLVAIFGYSLPVRLLRTDVDRDLIAYYQAVERMHNNEALYLDLLEKGPHKPDKPVYQYPPVLSSVLAMMPAMSFMTFARVWTLLLYLAFWVYSICLAKIAVGRVTTKGVLVAGLVLSLFPGTHIALSLGQIDPLLWALFGIALTVPTLRGAGFMAVTLVKPWAVWPLLWSFRDGRKVITNALIVFLVAVFLGIFMRSGDLYFSEWLTWFRDILPSLGQGTWSSGNWSISFAVLRVINQFGLWDYSGGILPLWARLWLLLCGIVLPMLVGFFLRKKCTILQLSAIGCTAVIFSPICWTSYLPVLLTVTSRFFGQKYQLHKN